MKRVKQKSVHMRLKDLKREKKKRKKKKEAKRVTLLGDFGSVRFVGLLVKVYIFLSLLQD